MIFLDGVPYFWSLWAYMFLLGYFMLSLSKSHLCHLTSKVKKNCQNVVNSRKFQKVRNHLLHMTKFIGKPDSKKILNLDKASCSWIINSWWLRCKNEFLKNNSIKNWIESLEKKIRQTIDRHSLWKPLIPKNIFRFCTLCPQFFAYLFLSPSIWSDLLYQWIASIWCFISFQGRNHGKMLAATSAMVGRICPPRLG